MLSHSSLFFLHSLYSIGKLMDVHIHYFTLYLFRFPANLIKVKLANVHFKAFYFLNY